MFFIKQPVKDAYLIVPEKNEDERGNFARIFDKKVFHDLGIKFNMLQASISYNRKKGTQRGMHYQKPPNEEQKIVQCAKGSLYDVILDLRPGSVTYRNWASVELTDINNNLLFIPSGVAHGFQTHDDNTVIIYYVDNFYHPESLCVVNYKSAGIAWPAEPSVMLERDRDAPKV